MEEAEIRHLVEEALLEDLGGSLEPTGKASVELLEPTQRAVARIFSREDAVLCGTPFVRALYGALGGDATITSAAGDGDTLYPGEEFITIEGNARTIMAGVRTAANFLQFLSGIATRTQAYARALEGTHCRVISTRKAIPALRTAERYAVDCGGGIGSLWGKERTITLRPIHVALMGGMDACAERLAHMRGNSRLEVEIKALADLGDALSLRPDLVILSNFAYEEIEAAITAAKGTAKLCLVGIFTPENVGSLAASGVDYIAVGSLTKGVKPIEMGLKFAPA
ncbi:MAG: hypothetical protein K6A65_03945 [Succinivibrionaceae bacterium]|nr:hypothetical protein [Succinivibrionaceae bacterium]